MLLAGKYEISVHPYFIAQVKKDTTAEGWKEVAGMDIYWSASCDGVSAVFLNVINKDDAERFWKEQHKELKGFIADKFEDFLEFMLGDPGGCATIPLTELRNFRMITEDDTEEANDSIDWLIDKYQLDREAIEACW